MAVVYCYCCLLLLLLLFTELLFCDHTDVCYNRGVGVGQAAWLSEHPWSKPRPIKKSKTLSLHCNNLNTEWLLM